MRRPHAGLLACSIAASAWAQDGPTAPPVPTPAPPPAPAPAEPPPPVDPAVPAPGAAAAAPAATGQGVRWRVPLAVSGSLGYDLRLDHVESERSRVNQQLTATIQAASYIYQPWLAVVNGQLGLTLSRARGGEQDGMDRDQFVTGNLRVGVFPRSRFPFEARYEVSDSRIDPALGGGIDYRSQTFGVLQRYRPASGDFHVMASYERRSQDGASIGEDTQDALLADFSSRWRRQAFNASLSRTLSRRRSTDEKAEVRSVVLRHSAGAGSDLSVESSLNWNEAADRLQSGDSDQRVAQWSSLAVWRPAARPYAVTASVRGFKFSDDDADDIETFSAAVAGHYELSPQLRLTANASASRSRGALGNSWVGAVGAAYQGDTRRWGDWTHNWFGGGSLSRSHLASRDEGTVSGQLGQSVTRSWGPTDGASWALTMSQTASASHVRGRALLSPGDDPDSRALAHTVGLGWNQVGAGGNASVRLTLSDARQFKGDRSRFQMLNFQVSGTHEIDRQRSWAGNLTVQRMFQHARTVDLVADPSAPQVPLTVFDFDRQITHSASGELSYQHANLFNVPRLRFSSILRISGDSQHQRKVLVALPDRETGSWENRLDWRVGRLDTGAVLRTSQVDGTWRTALMLRVLRNFGD